MGPPNRERYTILRDRREPLAKAISSNEGWRTKKTGRVLADPHWPNGLSLFDVEFKRRRLRAGWFRFFQPRRQADVNYHRFADDPAEVWLAYAFSVPAGPRLSRRR
jgi:hypothetical protein